MKKNTLLIIGLIIVTGLFVFKGLPTTLADSTSDIINKAFDDIRPSNAPTHRTIDVTDSTSGIGTILALIAGLLASVAGIWAVIMIIINATRYITSGGDKSKMDTALKGIRWAVVGLVSIMLAWGIINTIITQVFQLGGSSVTTINTAENLNNSNNTGNLASPNAGSGSN